MLEKKFVTAIRFPKEDLSPVGLFCDAMARKDPSFEYEIRRINARWNLLVYSTSKNQARSRGEWLTTKTELFQGLDFQVTHRLTLEKALQERPTTVRSLRGKRRR